MSSNSVSKINFQKSFFVWQTQKGSTGRFSVESICRIINGNNTNVFLLLAGVLACDVYGKKRLIYNPPYFYQALFGTEECKIFRDYFGKKTDGNTVQKISDVFTYAKWELHHSAFNKLSSFEEIENAVFNNKNIVAEIKIPYTVHFIELLLPVKHINIERKDRQFQIETGWIAMPVPENINCITASCFERGFVAFNNLTVFEFAYSIEYKTKGIMSKKFFSKHISQSAEINLFCTVHH